MALRSKYTAIPDVPFVGVEEWLSRILNALKENVELLNGTRGEDDLASMAVNRSALSVSVPPAQQMVRVSAEGAGVSISGANVPTINDHDKLIVSVQLLANDVANLRATVETLVVQLKG